VCIVTRRRKNERSEVTIYETKDDWSVRKLHCQTIECMTRWVMRQDKSTTGRVYESESESESVCM
jgi:hypothetical protein